MLQAPLISAPEDQPDEATTPARSAAHTRVLLTRLAVALNRRRAYAADHPMVIEAEAALHATLSETLAAGVAVAFAVAHRELLLNGVVLDATSAGRGTTARELSERLHRRGVGALSFHSGVTLEATREALGWLSREQALPGAADAASDRAAEESARGSHAPKDPTPAIPGVTIKRVAYDRLLMGDGEQAARQEIDSLWRALAAAAFDDYEFDDALGRMSTRLPGGGAGEHTAGEGRAATGGGRGTGDGHGGTDGGDAAGGAGGAEGGVDGADGDPLANASPEDIAAAITQRTEQAGYARRVAFVLLSLANQVTTAPTEVREELGHRLRSVLHRIGESSLGAIVRAAGAAHEQRRFMCEVISALPAQAVVEWLEVAARATDQQLSHQLLRILAKLSRHGTERRGRQQDQQAVRSAARELVNGWQLADPNPTEHRALLDHIAQFDAARRGPDAAGITEPREDARLVQMACEIGVVGEDTIEAARHLIADGHTTQLFAWLAASPTPEPTRALREVAIAPAAVIALLLHDPFDAGAARTLVAELDAGATPVLLDALERSPSRTARRVVYDRLREFGPAIAPALLQKLEDSPPWYFARNLLALLRDVTSATSGGARPADLRQFLHHAAEQVRAEAVRLLLEDEKSRELAMRHALDDTSARVVHLGVDAALATGEGAPASRKPVLSSLIASRLMQVGDNRDHDPELRARAVRALAYCIGPTVRDWLLAHVSRRTLVLRRTTLAEASPVVLAALGVLASRFAGDPRVTPLLAQARSAQDARRDAVEESTPTPRTA